MNAPERNRPGAGVRPVLCFLCLWLWAPVADAQSSDHEAAAGRDFAAELLQVEARLATDADNPELLFERARLQSFLKRYDDALADYETLAGRYPDNVDYIFGRAQLLAWMGRDAEALAGLERAARMAPEYEAVWRLRFRVQQRQPGRDAAARLEELRLASAARFPDAGWWQEQTTPQVPGEHAWILRAGASVEELSNSLPGWNDQFAALDWRRSAAARYGVRVARSNRFSETDIAASAVAEWRFGNDWFAGAELGVTPDADFLAKRRLSAHLGRTFGNGWTLDFMLRRREFDTAAVNSYRTTVEYYFGAFRAAYTLDASHLQGATTSLGHVASLSWYRSEKISYRLTIASGEEAEVIAPGQVLETDVAGVSVGGSWQLSDRVGLDWWAGSHEQGDFYRRTYAGLAVSVGL